MKDSTKESLKNGLKFATAKTLCNPRVLLAIGALLLKVGPIALAVGAVGAAGYGAVKLIQKKREAASAR